MKSGDARVAITGQVALADEEFATVAEGAAAGLLGSVVLVTLWLYLAVKTWRLIVPILVTLVLGLVLTLCFAAVAVGTLNLISVGFAILFVGIAVDFAIQFSVRFRERRHEFPDLGEAMRADGGAPGGADPGGVGGDLGWVPRIRADRFPRRGGAGADRRRRDADRVRLHADLPAGARSRCCVRRGESGVVGFAWAVPLDGRGAPATARSDLRLRRGGGPGAGAVAGLSSIPIRWTPRTRTPRRCAR